MESRIDLKAYSQITVQVVCGLQLFCSPKKSKRMNLLKNSSFLLLSRLHNQVPANFVGNPSLS